VHNLGAFGYFGTDPYLLNIWVNSEAIKSGFNWSHYDSPAIDSMIAQANKTASTVARDAIYEQVSVDLMQDAIYLPLWNVNDPFTMTSGVSGLHTTLNGYITFHSAALS
jgi:peptide/nickel transport system substrate-binding protein